MKHSEFMSALIRYYGKYENEFIESVILEHVLAIPENELENAMKKLMNNISRNDKYNPVDVAKIKKLFAKNNADIEAEALKWWDELNRKTNSYRDCVISDVRAYKALQTMGGWVWFCQRLKTDENGKDLDQWTRKQFVDLFKLYYENPPEGQIGILPGLGEMKKQPVMIGNQDQCLLISQGKNKSMELVEDMTKNLRRML